ncbi:hypothetical protein ODI_R3827 [Orrella dioscoreae]|uniref:Uncharacterized protein n=2 Tax=Orrella dioscoreae TaxID=1851544 RepID=A0A1C3K2T0_9BURK|nr:hypothetical protein ODI_01438 [Orrella dioscoreae]SOE51970.1 hypothetical protein ODI_R3827 [Orrella dioscoreae]
MGFRRKRGASALPVLMGVGSGVVAIFPLLVVIFSLLGYSAAMAIEDVFGIPRDHTYDSALSLLHLSSVPIAMLLEKKTTVDVLLQLPLVLAMLALVSFPVFAAYALFVSFAKSKSSKNDRSSLPVRLPIWLEDETPGERWGVKKTFFFSLLIIASPVLLWLAGYALFISVVLVFSSAFNSAKAHYFNWVAAAQYCTPIETRAEMLRGREVGPHRVVPCLGLWRNGELVAKGRYLASTSKYVLLFDPDSGAVIEESVEGLSMRKVGLSLGMTKLCITASQERRPHHEGGGLYPQLPEQCRLSQAGHQVGSGKH